MGSGCRSAGEARVAPAGEFVLNSDDPGPYRLELCAFDESGEREPTSTNANPIENVVPGGPDSVFRTRR